MLALGRLPLPPYIHDYAGDPERYQTVYGDQPGSAAAPTAGLHFTPEPPGRRFRRAASAWRPSPCTSAWTRSGPVKVDDLRAHEIHRETCTVPPETARAVAETKARGGRVIAVGTTTVRSLETAAPGGRPGRCDRGLDRRDRAVHRAGLPVQGRRRDGDELPPAALDAAGAGQRLRRPGADLRGVRTRRSASGTASSRSATRCCCSSVRPARPCPARRPRPGPAARSTPGLNGLETN